MFRPAQGRLLLSAWRVQWRGLCTAQKTSHEFQAETQQLLSIVTHSLYSEREVFLRELVSNASDALEKVRHRQAAGEAVAEPDAELAIEIDVDEEGREIRIRDRGIGMTEEELKANLGTIARSGSKQFVQQASSSADAASNIIGQFGVGFYAAFMVAEEVEVASRPADPAEAAKVWRSTGTGSYDIEDAPADADLPRGCTLTLKLKEDAAEFARRSRVEDVVRRYSNFVNFPIKLNGELVNTVKAVWTQAPNEVSEEEYTEFYRYVAGAFDEPMHTLHFRADAPLDIKALLFMPSSHSEKFGMGRMEPGVSLYSRKVLIEHRSQDILPDWLRFVRGVVDSEDLPLSISREKAQDARLISKLRDVLTKRIVRFLDRMKQKEPEEYAEFYEEHGVFLKEGVCQDFANQEALGKLLLFESSGEEAGKLISFDDYIARCTPEQQEVYYLCAPSREMAEQSPYFEAFKRANREVLFVYNAIDDFVMTNLAQYNGRKLVTAETADLELDGEGDKDADKDGADKVDLEPLCAWLKQDALKGQVSEVTVTDRLESTPAIITSHESGALRRMMRMVDQSRSGAAAPLPPQRLEINSGHAIIKGLDALREPKPELAAMLAAQLFDNAMITAGLLEDNQSRQMVARLNSLLEELVSSR